MNHTEGHMAFREDRLAIHRDGVRDDRSLGDLFSELSQETSTLFRQELELAKVEMTTKATTMGKNAAYVGLGGAVAFIGAIVLAFAVVYILDTFLPLWLSALIVGVAIAAVGYVLIQKGLDKMKATNLKPERTVETLKEDQQWMKEQVK